MKRIALFWAVWIAVLVIVPIAVVAQSDVAAVRSGKIKDFFVSMPDSLMPMLGKNERKDLIDIAESGMTTALDNDWNGRSRILALKDNYMSLLEDVADSITVEMALLPRTKDTLICLIRTIPLPRKDSELQIFDNNWKLQKLGGDISQYAFSSTRALDISLLPDTKDGVCIMTTMRQLDNLNDPQAFPATAREEKAVYKWNGRRFVRLK